MVYLKDLARGLVQDSPQTPGGSTEGAQRLQMQAEETEKEYDGVTDKVRAAAVRVYHTDTNLRVSLRTTRKGKN